MLFLLSKQQCQSNEGKVESNACTCTKCDRLHLTYVDNAGTLWTQVSIAVLAVKATKSGTVIQTRLATI